ncbi:hypothetical protein L345_00565, partial [Ophiophagus hannah]
MEQNPYCNRRPHRFFGNGGVSIVSLSVGSIEKSTSTVHYPFQAVRFLTCTTGAAHGKKTFFFPAGCRRGGGSKFSRLNRVRPCWAFPRLRFLECPACKTAFGPTAACKINREAGRRWEGSGGKRNFAGDSLSSRRAAFAGRRSRVSRESVSFTARRCFSARCHSFWVSAEVSNALRRCLFFTAEELGLNKDGVATLNLFRLGCEALIRGEGGKSKLTFCNSSRRLCLAPENEGLRPLCVAFAAFLGAAPVFRREDGSEDGKGLDPRRRFLFKTESVLKQNILFRKASVFLVAILWGKRGLGILEQGILRGWVQVAGEENESNRLHLHKRALIGRCRCGRVAPIAQYRKRFILPLLSFFAAAAQPSAVKKKTLTLGRRSRKKGIKSPKCQNTQNESHQSCINCGEHLTPPCSVQSKFVASSGGREGGIQV